MALRFLLLFAAVSFFFPFEVFRIEIYFYLRFPVLTGALLRLFLRFLCL